jgi:hypothetical protein
VLHGLSLVGKALAAVALRLARRLQKLLSMLVMTLQWLADDCTRICGHEGLLLLLVTLALVSLNLPSLAYIAAAGYGMFCRNASLTALPRLLAPLAIAILLVHYVLLVYNTQASSSALSPQTLHLHTWLGLVPTATTVSLLLSIVCVAVSLLHSSAWHAYAHAASPEPQTRQRCSLALDDANRPLQPPHAHERVRPGPHCLYYLIRRLPSEPADACILLERFRPRIAPPGTAETPTTPRLVCCLQWRSSHTAFVHRRSTWRWPDHLRFWLFRFSLDALMVLMVALCCLQRDLIHAAYLGLTLILFRRREELRLRGNGLFFWMPLANYSFIVLLLLFQAPFGLFFKGSGDCMSTSRRLQSCGGWEQSVRAFMHGTHWLQRCTVAHLLGLHHIAQPGTLAALNLSSRGTGLPLLMWLAIQVCCLSVRATR